MHPTTSELLALRDGEAGPELRRHVADCQSCRAELERLQALREEMRALPEIHPPRDGWSRLRSAVIRSRRAERWRRRSMAAAALIVVGLLGFLALRPASIQPPATVDSGGADEQALAGLITASCDLESVLRAPALRSPVLSPPEAANIVSIEDRIAVIDLELAVAASGPKLDHRVALWSDRVKLLDELVRARGGRPQDAQTRRAVYTGEGG